MDTPEITLPQHEAASAARAAHLCQKIDSLKESDMGTPVNVFHPPADSGGGAAAMIPAAMMAGMGGGGAHGMAGAGAGLGAGLVGGLLGGLLFGGGGFGGGRFGNDNNFDNRNFVTTADLNSALNGQTAGQNTNSILQSLATIQQLIPENEGHMQLALAQAQIALQNQASQGQLQVAAVNANLTATIDAARANIDTNIRNAQDVTINGFAGAQLTMANLGLQTANQTSILQTTIRDDGDKTRALIIAQNDAELNRIITTQANQIIELKAHGNIAANGLSITQTVNQNNLQQQQQQQQQQIVLGLSQLAALVGNIQIAQARQTSNVIGNTGPVGTAQTANPVNVM